MRATVSGRANERPSGQARARTPFPALLGLAGALAACAPTSDGTTQRVAIRTIPDGAACTVQRGTTVLGEVSPTPGSLAVDRSKSNLAVTCRKLGWTTASGMVEAQYKGIGLGKLLNGGIAAVVDDAATSADFAYDPAGITISLTASPGTQ